MPFASFLIDNCGSLPRSFFLCFAIHNKSTNLSTLSLKKAENADLKLVVVDAKNIDLSGFLNDLLKKDAILVINKSDLLKEKLDSEISKFNYVLISLKENLNIDKLISKIKNHLENKFISEEDILITRERHRQHLLCLLYTSPSPRDRQKSRMPSSY